MKVSARNVFPGRIKSLRPGAVNAEVSLELAGGEVLVAVVTSESVASLGLQLGGEAIALVKAPWVMLMTEAQGIRVSARNCLKGNVVSITDGAVNAEVVLELAGGSKVFAIVTRESVDALGLTPGAAATAVIKASHVVLAVAQD